jgi:hypothetical protein
MVELGSSGICIAWWHECDGCTGMRFNNAFWAGMWLKRFKGDPDSMATLRTLFSSSGIASGQRFTDSAVLEQVAKCFAEGKIHLCNQEVKPLPITIGELEAPAFPLAQRAPRPSSGSSSDSSLFPSDVDVLALADAQKGASEAGVPFCEECMKTRSAGGQSA